MKDLKGICSSCQKYVLLNLTHRIKWHPGGDRGYHYTEAYCNLCGDEVWCETIENHNLLAWGKMQEGSEYYDRIGGYHSEGEGWDPNGNYCGECGKLSCTQCYVWLQGKN